MRKFFTNIFATTGISLLVLSTVALFYRAQCLYLETVFQVWGANAVVHFGLLVLRKLEFQYAIVESFLHIALLLSVLAVSGFVFHWFTSTPIGILAIMGFVIYMISAVLHLLYMKREAREMNALIQRRNR